MNNSDFFCATGQQQTCPVCDESCADCGNWRRKWPTPEQLKKEHGTKWKDEDAVYRLDVDQGSNHVWNLFDFFTAKYMNRFGTKQPIVCACTPYGKPNSKWRPS